MGGGMQQVAAKAASGMRATVDKVRRVKLNAAMDAMAIARKFGKPDYFITMTANPAWTDVTRHLRFGETAANRPDLVARVFRIKLQALLDKLLKEHVLGVVIGREHCSRGLVCMHLRRWLGGCGLRRGY